MASRYSIETGDPGAHRLEVLALGARNLPDVSEFRYSKYYEDSPFGAPTFCLARDGRTETFVGMAALLPTQLRVAGEVVRGGIAADFAVDDGHRGFGPALQLQRCLLEQLGEAGFSFVYGSPNSASEPLFRRLGYVDLGRFTRFVKVFKTEFAVRRYLRRPVVARLAAWTVDPVLSILSRERLYRRSSALTVEKPRAFDERFGPLLEDAGRRQTVLGERSLEVLNWKYELSLPAGERKYEIFALRTSDAAIVGYIVYFKRGALRHVVDLLCVESQRVLDALLSEFVLDARRTGDAGIGLLYFGGGNLLTRRLRAFGFFQRKEKLGLLVSLPDGSPRPQLLVTEGWYLLAGDGDV